MRVIKNSVIITENELIEKKAVLFTDKIEAVIDEGKIPDGCELIDAHGLYLSPGFIDIHIHGCCGEDSSDADAAGIKKMAEGLLRGGVTGFLPTTLTLPKEKIIEAACVIRGLMEESRHWDGSAVLGLHAEGPFINSSKKGAQNAAHIQKPDASWVIENKDVIKIIALAPEMDENYSVIREIKQKSDILISLAHTAATYEQALGAIEAGAGHITHLFNAMTALTHREPGVVSACFNSSVTAEMICDNFHIHPAIYRIVYALKKDRLCLITDSIRAAGLSDGVYDLGGLTVNLNGIKCTLEDGTIAGSVLTLNRAVKNFYENAAVTLPEAVRCASLNPARAIGLADKKGSICEGKDADFVLFDTGFNVKTTIIAGRTVI